MSSDQTELKPKRRLFWRIYSYSLLMILAVGIASLLVFILVGDSPPWHKAPEHIAKMLKTEFDSNPKASKALSSRLKAIRSVIKIDLAVYGSDGSLLAFAGDKPPDPAPFKSRNLHRKVIMHHGTVTAPLAPQAPSSAFLAIRWFRGGGALRLALFLAAILMALGLVSIPLARSVARPLESLTHTARKLAAGKLSVRTGLDRKDEVGVLARTMDDMAEHLELRIRSEKELLANISHELRTPLARIKVALELCEERGTLEEIKSHLSGIGTDVVELDRLVGDVLTSTRLDLAAAGPDQADQVKMTLHKEQTDWLLLIDQAAERFAQLHPQHSLSRESTAENPQIEVDPTLIRRVLDNILDNAVAYSDPESAIELSSEKKDDSLLVEISDRGIGVSEAELPRLFEPFFRTDQSRDRKAGGTGLGLTLCKRIVEAHGGKIWARQREEEVGLTIGFSLPLTDIRQQ